jgi:hypothetical protein
MGGQGGVSCAVGEKEINLFEGEICRFGIEEVYNLFKLVQNKNNLIKCVLFLTGTKTRFKHMKIKYPFHARF